MNMAKTIIHAAAKILWYRSFGVMIATADAVMSVMFMTRYAMPKS